MPRSAAVITSTHNARVRSAAALARGRERRTQGRHLVEGPRALREALAAGIVEEVFATVDGARSLGVDDVEGGGHIASLTGEVPVTLVADHVLDQLADAVTPQGVVGVALTPNATLTALTGARLVVALIEVADPGNAGTIIRTADAAGADAVVLTAGSVDPFGPKAVRASVGSVYHLPVVVGVTAEELLTAARASGQRVVALDGSGDTSVFALDGTTPTLLLLGNEARGLPADVVAQADVVARVPIRGRAESLNVAAAAAVAIYAAAGDQGHGGGGVDAAAGDLATGVYPSDTPAQQPRSRA